MKMTPTLRRKIDNLIEMDRAERAEEARKHPNGTVMTIGDKRSEDILDDILNGAPSALDEAVEALSPEELIFVEALAWFGRGDGIAEVGATFESVMDYAKEMQSKQTAGYVAAMPLSTYLPEGLRRLGIGS